MSYFYWIFGVETAGRLSPFKGETPKRLKNSRFRAGSDYTRHPMLFSMWMGKR